MWQNYQNLEAFFLKNVEDKVLKDLKNFITSQDMWVRQMIEKHIGSDPFWRHVSYVHTQLQGLHDGYKYSAEPSWVTTFVELLSVLYICKFHYSETKYILSLFFLCFQNTDMFVVQLLNLAGDLLDLMSVVNPPGVPDVDVMTPHEVYQYIASKGHCSALIKVDIFDIFNTCSFHPF